MIRSTRPTPARPRLQMPPAGVSFTAAASGPPRFRMIGYTGAAMRISGFDLPIVADMKSFLTTPIIPILYDHIPDLDYVVGQSDSVRVEGWQLVVTGTAMGVSARAKQVVALGRAGYTWQASIGADPKQITRIEAGQTAELNGRTFAGPVYFAYDIVLREVSFVVLGGDGNTSVTVNSAGRPLPSRTTLPHRPVPVPRRLARR